MIICEATSKLEMKVEKRTSGATGHTLKGQAGGRKRTRVPHPYSDMENGDTTFQLWKLVQIRFVKIKNIILKLKV